ncbi:hypothetical protein QAD02_015684 [Eretmocerus hayati]|uniref:Uncharacterized protein n=1 Tax=Eretmocerus hayati TaxID=131215 RepID=A0ACC2P9C4_9HYME|nr:hypothetical protein QAD02_015684 [Eretmocerus hayati]
MTGHFNMGVLMGHFLKTSENVITYYDTNKNERDSVLRKLQGIVEKSCEYEEKFNHMTRTIRELTRSMESSGDPEKNKDLFKEKKNELIEYTPDVSNNKNLREYLSQVQEIVNCTDGTAEPTQDDDDDDIEMTQGEINVIDPFTKKRMTDPVKNKACGHVYDRASVTQMVNVNRNTKCPVVGCGDRSPILLENIITDIVTRRHLQNNPA